MSATNDIPREGPADDDGSGVRSLHEQWERDAKTIAARFNAKPEPSEQLPLGDDLPFIITYDDKVDCPECGGKGTKTIQHFGFEEYTVECAVCNGRKRVSPLFASTWLRQGA